MHNNLAGFVSTIRACSKDTFKVTNVRSTSVRSVTEAWTTDWTVRPVGRTNSILRSATPAATSTTQETEMGVSRRQYGFLIGFLVVWLAWEATWVVLAAIAAGLLCYLAVKVLEGDLDVNELTDRFRNDRSGR